MKMLSVALVVFALVPASGSLARLRDDDNRVALALNGVVSTYSERAAIVADLLQAASRESAARRARLSATRDACAALAATSATVDALRRADALPDYDGVQFKLEVAVSRLLAASDSDRTMFTDPHYNALKVRLRAVELRIGIAREQYDNAVALYNARLHTFPTRVTARLFGFREGRTFADLDSHSPLPRGLLGPGARRNPWA
ncbi:LemA family protein [Burkholderia aenigmatica]|uniref:LemA family protein n=1 Tax=Burkholderia aenigmatica TaxID=2015348 RepID=UPI00265122E2|nr:LemA family protein [Burkholderia aenigmatica]MDN7875040.1 LemA family protein [Burkholderia aenigmatica]